MVVWNIQPNLALPGSPPFHSYREADGFMFYGEIFDLMDV
jgi:hypothetical protein